MSNDIKKQISCMDDYDPSSLQPEQAKGLILDAINRLQETQQVPIRDALMRVLADDIYSNINVPSGKNSAMDGYAIYAEDIPKIGKQELKQVGTSLAGKAYKGKTKLGECVRIMTGAIMPEGMDTVIIQENIEKTDTGIRIDSKEKNGANVREAGEDIAVGDCVLQQGTLLTPAELGLVASLGIANITVYRPLRVSFFSTGDELRSIGDELEDGMIFDSNRYTLYGMLKRLGVEINDMGVIKDNPGDLKQAFTQAAKKSDVVISTGGVSVGDADYIKDVLGEKGEINFWKVAMKPGRPLTFGKINDAIFFGLPGNPVSVMVTFYQFVQPALQFMSGASHAIQSTFKVRCESNLKKRAGRVEYQRGILTHNDNNELVAYKTGAQGSGILSSMSRANCFIILPMESEGISSGDIVEVQPFHGLV